MIAFACSGCGKNLRVHEDMGGKRAKCPQCGQSLRVPSATPDLATLPPKPAAGRPAERLTVASDRPSAAPHRLAEGASGDTAAGRPARASGTRSELTDFLAPPQAPDEIGRLGPYRVLKVLGAGGMGVVYQAEDPQLQRKVALKAMLPSLGASSTARERFLREARAAAAIEHDHIVHIYQVGEDRGVPFLAMQFLQGEPLDERLKRDGSLPVPEVLRIGRETAEGLAAAHARGLIHRDIKPANLWLEGERRRVKILDFGLARSAGADSQLTQQGAIVGTPAYMAPEQAAGQAVDARSDLFSLGCVLYRLCTGDMAFKGSDTISTLVAVATVHPRPPHELSPDVPRPLSDLVMRLLAKKPDDRFGSARAVADALAALERQDLTTVQPARVPKTKPKATPPPTARRKASSAAPRRRTTLVVGTVLGVVLLAVGGFFLVSAFNKAPAPATPAVTTKPEQRPAVAVKATTGLRAVPPSEATILFDGKSLANWVRKDGGVADWKILSDGAMEVGSSDLLTRTQFGLDYHLHAEFWIPLMAQAKGQQRGNSGVFLNGHFEVQILDSHGKARPDARDCGALFGLIAPSRNACKPPEQWQVFDITFHTPRPGRPGHVTVVQNGTKVIDNGAFDQVVSQWGLAGAATDPGPILLQSHGAKVRFRNLWLLPISSDSRWFGD